MFDLEIGWFFLTNRKTQGQLTWLKWGPFHSKGSQCEGLKLSIVGCAERQECRRYPVLCWKEELLAHESRLNEVSPDLIFEEQAFIHHCVHCLWFYVVVLFLPFFQQLLWKSIYPSSIYPSVLPYIHTSILPNNKYLLTHHQGPGTAFRIVENQDCPRGVISLVEKIRTHWLPSLEFSSFILLGVAVSSLSSRFPGGVPDPRSLVLPAETMAGDS